MLQKDSSAFTPGLVPSCTGACRTFTAHRSHRSHPLKCPSSGIAQPFTVYFLQCKISVFMQVKVAPANPASAGLQISMRQASLSRATKQLMPTPRGRRAPPTQGAGSDLSYHIFVEGRWLSVAWPLGGWGGGDRAQWREWGGCVDFKLATVASDSSGWWPPNRFL